MKDLRVNVILMLFVFLTACAVKTGNESKTTENLYPERPKLIVGIVVDQMRYDFLFRYWDRYSQDGFKKLLNEGYNFQNANYSYVPTYTAPGHASIYTGTTPDINGIIGNSWYSRELGRTIYCVEDKSVKSVGAVTSAGEMSPRNLLSTTITDQLKLATNKRSKVIAVALKDRGAVLPGGFMADGAYWYDGKSGNFISSTFYQSELPGWVTAFNAQKLPGKYLDQNWETLYPIDSYKNSTADNVSYEEGLKGKEESIFPYELAQLKGNDWDLIKYTPFGNTITKDLALTALKAEQLGQRGETDFLSVSFSSTDYIGHNFGPNSVEAEDTYLRLDADIAEIIAEAEKAVGKGNVLFFLTADHGVANIPAYMLEERINAGAIPYSIFGDSVKQYMAKAYGPGNWLLKSTNQQLYLNRKLIAEKKMDLAEVQQQVAEYALTLDGVSRTITATDLQRTSWNHGVMQLVENGYNAKRSGDVILQLETNWQVHPAKGTTHGSYSTYDIHVPLVWYGWQVKPGKSSTKVSIADIAPTLATWLNIQEPSGSTGKALQEYMK